MVADNITQYRPIALANFFSKIIIKITANYLALIMPKIILPNQVGFIRSRHIHDCTTMVSESVNMLDRKAYVGNIGLKLYIHKAFDTLNWEFLLRVLHFFGFHSIFIKWISVILNSAKLSAIINGSLHGFFNCGKGVRQGDPLSPLLFCIAEEVLSRGILDLHSKGLLKPISAPRGCSPPSHTMYTDDVFLFCRGDLNSLKNLASFLDDYEAASGKFIL